MYIVINVFIIFKNENIVFIIEYLIKINIDFYYLYIEIKFILYIYLFYEY